MNLTTVIKTIMDDIDRLRNKKHEGITRIEEKYDAKIDQLKIALDVNEMMNTACLECEGKRYIKDAVPPWEIPNTKPVKCSRCHGRGLEPKKGRDIAWH
jgi:hypothetical protein